MTDPRLEQVWRREAPHVLTALARRFGHFSDCEDATQQALIAAAAQWPSEGPPDNPRGWLIRVASRRLTDQLRSDEARRQREDCGARQEARSAAAVDEVVSHRDDTLQLMVLCCHPALTRATQVALMLRAVSGLTTAQIAAGFLVPEATMAQRISRAKATLTRVGATFGEPAPAELPNRILSVRHAIVLAFTEGHTRTSGILVTDSELTGEAIRLARRLNAVAPPDSENTGLLALLLLTQARAAARTDGHGDLIPLEEQNRSLWDQELIAEGTHLLEAALPNGYVGPFQLQAAIAAVHDEAQRPEDTDWPQLLALYRMLDAVAPSEATSIGLATALAVVAGPGEGLAVLDTVRSDRNHRYHAVRGHLLLRADRHDEARQALITAARLTRSIPEQRYLNRLLGQIDV